MSEGSRPAEHRYYINSISISNLWGYRDIELKLRKDINIFVGKNGSGKTTVLNIIADILLLDFNALGKIRFDKIILHFASSEVANIPMIQVVRLKGSSTATDQGFDIKYFNNFKDRKPTADQTILYEYRNESSSKMGLLYNLGIAQKVLQPVTSNIASHINQLATVTWISVHRKSNTSNEITSVITIIQSINELSK